MELGGLGYLTSVLHLNVTYYAPDRREGAISVAFVHPPVRPSVSYIARIIENPKAYSVPKFGMKVP